MKRNKLLIGVCAMVLLLSTGCGKKQTVACKIESDGMFVGLNVNYKGDDVDSMDMKYEIDLSSLSDSEVKAYEKEDLCKALKSDMDELKGGFKNCKQKVEKKKLTVTADIDVKKISKDELKKVEKPETAKKDLEKSGYKCTIEK